MGKTALKYIGILTGLYIIVYNGSKAGSVVTKGAAGASSFVRTLQGR
ncbi:hypothetical protein [Nocardioides soli]|uniref:Uncharacterized protein n=1 Tax=Nocardioides soli TaxID=1036020 RepID=A0A7W4Z201_9ACTN|nr:hypothetical protein [Nocardioides soli]MBB3043924.1 hypothetical protein [Nocardioides soli]